MDPVSKARNVENNVKATKRLGGCTGKGFMPGQSGNPLGARKKPITEMMERILKNPQNRKDIENSMLEILKSQRMASVLMLREVADRVEGKVAQEVELSGAIDTLQDSDLDAKLKKLAELLKP